MNIIGTITNIAGGGKGGGSRGAQPAQAQANPHAEYDVDRWERTEGTYDLSGITTVQAVREDWERSGRRKFLEKRAADKETLKKHAAAKPPLAPQQERPAPKPAESERNRLLSRMDEVKRIMGEAPAAKSSALNSTAADGSVAYSGKSLLPDSLVASPVNSALLAIDTLALGPLTLEQTEPLLPYSAAPSKSDDEAARDGAYMDRLRAGRAKKYVVRIV